MTSKENEEIAALLRFAAAHIKTLDFGPILIGDETLDFSRDAKKHVKFVVDRIARLLDPDAESASESSAEPQEAAEEGSVEEEISDIRWTYVYPRGAVEITWPKKLVVSPQGHTVTDSTGQVFELTNGWIAIKKEN